MTRPSPSNDTMSDKTVLLVGTGFIGLHVLELLLADGYAVTALVRRPAQADAVQAAGATPVLGDLDDAALLTSEAAKVGVVLHIATADHLASAEAILAGIRQRAARGRSTIYIHTSGSAITDDGAYGAFASSTVYADTDRAAIDALPETQPHRNVDAAIVRAQQTLGTSAKIALMIPPAIYGWNPAHRRLTIQLPGLVRFALKAGYAGYVGEGKSVMSRIHVADLARAYLVLLHAMEAREPHWVLENPYFFAEDGAGDFSWREAAEHIGKGLKKQGRIESAEPRSVLKEEYGELFGEWTGTAVGLNSRVRAVRLRELGWEAREKGMWESLEEDELPAILEEWDQRK